MASHIDLLPIHQATQTGSPLIVHEVSMVQQGALVSYGADFRLLGVQAARLVVKVLQGLSPAAIQIETPDTLPLAVNMTTARAIGLTIPRRILERADQWVE